MKKKPQTTMNTQTKEKVDPKGKASQNSPGSSLCRLWWPSWLPASGWSWARRLGGRPRARSWRFRERHTRCRGRGCPRSCCVCSHPRRKTWCSAWEKEVIRLSVVHKCRHISFNISELSNWYLFLRNQLIYYWKHVNSRKAQGFSTWLSPLPDELSMWDMFRVELAAAPIGIPSVPSILQERKKVNCFIRTILSEF